MNTASTSAGPTPQGNYKPASRFGDLIYTSGMTPRVNGKLRFTGPVRSNDPVEQWRDAVIIACRNALTAARSMLGQGEGLAGVPSMTVFLAAEPGFVQHSKLADFASGFLVDELGEKGIGSRAAVGVATLPGNAPVEIQIVFAVER
ncbi:MAG: RidA family protein [Mesorhizobium sp.]|nr:RidA family protein [Mesorhizobium sp.]MBL8576303.1 RidA family protein [Mesorhizobium sp.]